MGNNKVIFFKLDAGQQTPAQIKTKIAQIDAIINSLYDTALKSVQSGNIAEYRIDTGQTIQQVKYSNTTTVTNTIQQYEKIRVMLQNKLTGRRFTLVDQSNFRRR